jgi:hypothetical protein
MKCDWCNGDIGWEEHCSVTGGTYCSYACVKDSEREQKEEERRQERIRNKKKQVSCIWYVFIGIKDFFTKMNLTKIIALMPFLLLTVIVIAFYDYCIGQSIVCTYGCMFCTMLYFWLIGAYSIRYEEDNNNLNISEMSVEDIDKAIADGRLKSTLIYSEQENK